METDRSSDNGSDESEEARLLQQVVELSNERGRLNGEVEAMKARMDMEERRRSREQQSHTKQLAALEDELSVLTLENSQLRSTADADAKTLAAVQLKMERQQEQERAITNEKVLAESVEIETLTQRLLELEGTLEDSEALLTEQTEANTSLRKKLAEVRRRRRRRRRRRCR